ncbi:MULTISPECIES: hypothetical protein [unclassified Arcicella]|uniref:hypothetical protein n=1 Tax=unclassified Arcicella TaxID=2644986 RepID=UPI00285FDCCF|nr:MULTISPECIES: hypothetical protein [unclassified Arcicella]MDR6559980.1 hypothetical protein [Arcicella sp. BE51]MDR6810413.1 hypothetical protein [Arcicella sp. BE140]MDR6821763.1 hypothetical protein [Arcicella sp. BE139]
MQTYSVEILNPKAYKLLKNLADLKLISFKEEKPSKKELTDFQKKLLEGPTWTEEEYQTYLKNRDEINKIGEK